MYTRITYIALWILYYLIWAKHFVAWQKFGTINFDLNVFKKNLQMLGGKFIYFY
jgi:hypothetical protein